MKIVTRKPVVDDAQAIRDVIRENAENGLMLPRPLVEVYDSIRDFTVAEADGEIIGCVALHVCWEDLAEIRSLSVRKSCQGTGAGRMLVDAAMAEAPMLGVRRIFCLTYVPDFFEKFGFRVIEKNDLPHKIWADCIKCPHFPDCREIAMARKAPDA